MEARYCGAGCNFENAETSRAQWSGQECRPNVETCKNGDMLASDLASKLRIIAFVLVLLVAILLLLPFGWLLFRTENFDTPGPMPIFILSELPLVVSLIVLCIADDEKRASIGAGIAFGAASIFTLLVPVFYFGTIGANWMRHPPYPHLAAFRYALGYAFLVSVCLMIFARLNRKDVRAFFAGGAAGIGYSTLAFILGYLVFSIPGSGAEKAKEADERVPPAVAAAPTGGPRPTAPPGPDHGIGSGSLRSEDP